jgi:hypothetical protein
VVYEVEDVDQDKYKQLQLYNSEFHNAAMEDMSDETFLHIAEHVRVQKLVVGFALAVMDPTSGFLSQESDPTIADGHNTATNNPQNQRDGPNQRISIYENSNDPATPNTAPKARTPVDDFFQDPSLGYSLPNATLPSNRPSSANEDARNAIDKTSDRNEVLLHNPQTSEPFPGSESLPDSKVILFRFDINPSSSTSAGSSLARISSDKQWIRIPLALAKSTVNHSIYYHLPVRLALTHR